MTRADKVDFAATEEFKRYMAGVISVYECRELLFEKGFTMGPRVEMDRLGCDTTTGFRSRD